MWNSNRNRLPLRKKLLFTLAVFLIFLVGIEGTARLAESALSPPTSDYPPPGWQTEFFRGVFDWHEPDPDLLWRFKPNLDNRLIETNSEGLIADEIQRPKPEWVFRIVILGDSSPVGLGLRNRSRTFPEVLQRRLDALTGEGKHVEVITAAVSGYSSAQIRRYMELKGWLLAPDAVIIYCGNNDASVSGYLSDRELLNGQRFSGIRNALAQSSAYRLLRALLLRRENASARPLRCRVSPEEFGENLAAIAADCQERNCAFIIVQPPVPLLWPAALQFRSLRHLTDGTGELIFPKPIAEVLGRDLHYCLSKERIDFLYVDIDPVTRLVFSNAPHDTLPPEVSSRYWARRVHTSTALPLDWNNLGVACWELDKHTEADSAFENARRAIESGDTEFHDAFLYLSTCSALLYNRGINLLDADGLYFAEGVDSSSQAFQYLDSALQLDYFSLRIKNPYREAIADLTASPGVIIIDGPRLFSASGGERLFVDHCHPNPKGHRLIADALATRLAPLINMTDE